MRKTIAFSLLLRCSALIASSLTFSQEISQEALDQATPSPYDSIPVTEFFRSSGDYRVDSMIRPTGSRKWGGPIGTGALVTYSFAAPGSVWPVPYENRAHPFGEYVRNLAEPENDLGYITEEEKVYVRDAFAAWEAVANLQFVEVTETPTRVGAIRIARTSNTLSGFSMHSSTPTYSAASADIWIRSDAYPPAPTGQPFDELVKFPRLQGTAARWDLLHEIGHSLGLRHPFDGPEEYNLPKAEDNMDFTVMSYTETEPYYISALPLYDQLAMQYLYGPKGSNNAGIETNYDFFGSAKSDEFTGMSGDDEFYTLEGDDRIHASGGSDFVHGGTGLDTLVLELSHESYTIQNSDEGLFVASLNVANDTDVHTVEVERLEFADSSLAFDLNENENAGITIRLITTTLGISFLDAATMGVGIDLFDNGAEIRDIIAVVLEHPIFLSLAGGETEDAAVALVLKNVLGRTATNSELDEARAQLSTNGGTMTLVDFVEVTMNSASVTLVADIEALQETGIQYLPIR